ncbi:MAG: hypothetical protein PHX08_08240 [Lachnospiraceae bacterium]|nr:hypothetical protein [Lachnospiraceae bacterium]
MTTKKVKVLEVYYHYVSEYSNQSNGLYSIEVNRTHYTIFRNGMSWGVISHFVNEPVTKCIGYVREDMVKPIEDAIKEYLSNIKESQNVN